jgi:hypothetical protein
MLRDDVNGMRPKDESDSRNKEDSGGGQTNIIGIKLKDSSGRKPPPSPSHPAVFGSYLSSLYMYS